MREEIVTSPCSISFDGGKTWRRERYKYVCVDDWRETPFGMVNFGWAQIIPLSPITSEAKG